MSKLTRCPNCSTKFRASDAQLAAYQGKVRCGHCAIVFNALEHLVNEAGESDVPLAPLPKPPTSLAPTPKPPASKPIVAATPPPLPVALPPILPLPPEPAPAPAHPTEEEASLLTDYQIEQARGENFVVKPHENLREMPWWMDVLWGVGCGLLILLALGQGLFYQRFNLVAHYPQLRPALGAFCQALGCQINFPKNIQQVSIESSELQADPARQNVVLLGALLRNRADYVQEFPALELTLTNQADEPVARRIFLPQEYLKTLGLLRQGFAPNGEMNVQLRLRITAPAAVGYRLYLFYP